MNRKWNVGCCILAAQAVSLFLPLKMTTKTKPAKLEGNLSILMFSKGLLIGKRPFQDRTMSGKNAVSGHILNKFQRPTILQLNTEGQRDHYKEDKGSLSSCFTA